MASDTFDISAEAVAAVNSQLESMNAQIEGINRSSSLTATMISQIPDAMKGAADVFKEMQIWMEDISNNTSQAALEARNLAKELRAVADSAAKNSKELKSQEITLKSIVKSVSGWAIGVTSLAALVGTVAKQLVKAYDNTRLLGGMSLLANTQFEKSNKNIAQMSKFIYDIRKSFQTTIKEAGEYATILGRAGMEKAQILNYGKAIYAAEKLYGQSSKDQVETIQSMVNNYQMMDDSAARYSSLIQQIAVDMPNLSFDTVLDDIKQINETQKLWNGNLLTSTSLYKLMTDKKLSKELGLDKVPVDFRRSLVKSISGINQEMPFEWKAAVAMSMPQFKGMSPAAAGLSFEKLAASEDKQGLLEQFKGVAQFIQNKIGGQTLTAEKIIGMRSVAKTMGLAGSEGEAAQLVEQLKPGGAFDVDNIAKLLKESKEKQEELSKQEQDQTKQMQQNIKTAATYLHNITSTEDLILSWLETTFMNIFKVLVDLTKAISKTAQEIYTYFAEPEEKRQETEYNNRIINTTVYLQPKETSGIASKIIKESMYDKDLSNTLKSYVSDTYVKELGKRYSKGGAERHVKHTLGGDADMLSREALMSGLGTIEAAASGGDTYAKQALQNILRMAQSNTKYDEIVKYVGNFAANYWQQHNADKQDYLNLTTHTGYTDPISTAGKVIASFIDTYITGKGIKITPEQRKRMHR